MVDKFAKQNLETDFGQKVNVDRATKESWTSPDAAHAGAELKRIGALLNPKPDTLEHLGSACIHIYQAAALGQLFFVCQYPLGNTSEEAAGKAMTELRGTLMEAYSRKRQTKRSGF